MRIVRSTLIGTAVAAALFGREELTCAQVAGSETTLQQDQVQEVVVTGLRASLEASIEYKRSSDEVVQVVTADDIGKMPDKNVADALQRLPGVTISSAGANEGGFDEADRVSMRGTNPSLTLTLINGHAVASGDWFVLDQTGTVGRSVSYTLLPSEIVRDAVVYQSSDASLVEGGVAGTVDIITRKPTDFQQLQTIQVSAGAVYADLPDKTSPQFSALGNWLNDDRTFGVLGQLFYEERYLRRDGQELLGYGTITPGSNLALAHPDLANVQYPVLLGAPLFQQTREREGGLVDFEWQPNDHLTVDLNGFYSKLDATNLNDNYLFWGSNIINGGNGQLPPAGTTCAAAPPQLYNSCVPGLGLQPGYKVAGNTLTSATFAPYANTFYGVYDQISRPDESSSTGYVDLDVNWSATDHLHFFGQVGVTEGHGRTPTQDVSETLPGVGAGGAYTLYGTTSAATWNLGNTINTSPNPNGVPVAFSWIFGDQNMDVFDREAYAKIDGAFDFNNGIFKDLKFGARYAEHERHLWGAIGQGPGCQGEPCPTNTPPANSPFNPLNYPTGYVNYPNNYGFGLGGPFPTHIWYWTPAQLAAYDLSYTNRDPVSRADWTSDYGLDEKDPSAYLQLDFKGSIWSGNIGVRYVQTKESVTNNVGVTATTPGAITTSAFGPYITETTNNTYNDVLPTGNFKINLTPDLVARAAAGQSVARPDYSALASSISLGAPPPPGGIGSGSGANPNLAPIKSTNGDLALEWYFEPRALLSADAFYMHLDNYVAYGTVQKNFFTSSTFCPNGCLLPYLITVPVNATGKVYGAQFSYQQPISDHFGVVLNYTYADGKQTSQVTINGDDRLVGTSKNTANAIAYFESSHFSARVAYNYRSAFYSGLDRNTAFTQAAIGTVDATLAWYVNDNFAVTLDGLNLNNPTLKYWALNEDQPRAFYKNGAQYYLNLRFKL
jgi:iron complex outermembrane recepter protein